MVPEPGSFHDPAAILQMIAPYQQAVTITLHGQPEGQPFVAVVVSVVVAAAPHLAELVPRGTLRGTRVVGSAGAVCCGNRCKCPLSRCGREGAGGASFLGVWHLTHLFRADQHLPN